MLVEEGTQALDKYLDDAVLGGIGLLYVIHGKGTGAMRAGIQDFLKGIRMYEVSESGNMEKGTLELLLLS